MYYPKLNLLLLAIYSIDGCSSILRFQLNLLTNLLLICDILYLHLLDGWYLNDASNWLSGIGILPLPCRCVIQISTESLKTKTFKSKKSWNLEFNFWETQIWIRKMCQLCKKKEMGQYIFTEIRLSKYVLLYCVFFHLFQLVINKT